MDVATLIGIVLAFLSLIVGLLMEGGDMTKYVAPSAFLIVVPSTLSIALAGGYISDIPKIIAGLKAAIMTKTPDASHVIDLMVKFAEKARREGLLALEEAVKDVDDPFFKKGIEMAVDGTDPEQLREILEAEIYAKRQSDKVAAKFFAAAGGFSPTLGIIGTVLGLVIVLQNLSDPGSLGPHIATAFIATLYGVFFANAIYLPIGNKLTRISEIECHHMELVVEGVLSIQSGSNPRVIQQKLTAFMGMQATDKSAKKAA